MRRGRARGLVLLLWLAFAVASVSPADAEDARGKPARVQKKSRAKKTRAKKQAKAAPQPPAPKAAEASEPSASSALAATDDAEVKKEGDTEVKVLEFSGLDIEGQLKTPQMLYFLNRLRAEFDRPRLPHRSFLPELERSTKDDDL